MTRRWIETRDRLGNPGRFWYDDAKLPGRFTGGVRPPGALPAELDPLTGEFTPGGLVAWRARYTAWKAARPVIASPAAYRANLISRGYQILSEGVAP